jgi:hypothetical protein
LLSGVEHFWSHFWSLLVTRTQIRYERVGCLQAWSTFGHISGHFWSQEHRLCMRGLVAFTHFWSFFGHFWSQNIQALYEKVGCFQTLLVTFFVSFGHKIYRLCMRGLVAFEHFWSLFWSLLVTRTQALYEKVGCFHTFVVTFGHFFGHFWSQEHRLCMRRLVAFRRGALLVTFLVTFGHKNTGSLGEGWLLSHICCHFGHFFGHFWSQEHRLFLRRLVAFTHLLSLLVTFWVTFGHRNTGSV